MSEAANRTPDQLWKLPRIPIGRFNSDQADPGVDPNWEYWFESDQTNPDVDFTWEYQFNADAPTSDVN
jgi:hypothetical protein